LGRHFKRGRFQSFLAPAGKNYRVALPGEGNGDSLADPAACTSYDGDLLR
jgi:hypothetical protein